MKDINYQELHDEIVEVLKKTREIVVATSYKDKVTARTVYCICNGLDIYFITSRAYTKYKQIQKNNKIALAIKNLQAEGVAEVLGHPTAIENEFIKDICELDEGYKKYYDKYSRYKNTTLIKFNRTLITLYKGDGIYEYLNVDDKIALKKGR